MNIPRIKYVEPQEGHILAVTFTNGERKKYDAARLLKQEMFAPLMNQAFFRNVAVEPGGYAVSWNSKLDVSEYELWRYGEDMLPDVI
ncbi:MAG: DUF2442 domain-containing protein [Pseudomonadota bacterium]